MEIVDKIANGLKSEKAKVNFLAFIGSLKEHDEEDDVAAMLAADIMEMQESQEDKLLDLQEEMEGIFPPEKDKYPVLMVNGRNINHQGNFGYTELHKAVMEHDLQLVLELIHYGADKTIKDISGHTAYDKAARLNYDDLLEVLG